jgi:hypothetical protein
MIREAIDRVLELGDPDLITVGERTWRKGGYQEIVAPLAEGLTFYSLDAFVKFTAIAEEQRSEGMMIIVVDPQHVELVSELNREKKRETYAVACPLIDSKFAADSWMPQDVFVTEVQAHFLNTDDRGKLLKIAGNLRKGQTAVLEDDGVTQKVTTARGVVAQEMTEVPNPVILRQWETFSEIDPPERQYIVRVRGGSEERRLELALFKVPNPTASRDTCAAIAGWLREHVPPSFQDSILG